MKTYALFQQYIWLVNTIYKSGEGLTLSEINERWIAAEIGDGLPLARSTFNRHRDAILDNFGIIIECDKGNAFRYYIENSEVLEEDTIQNWMLSTISVNNMLAENKGVHNRIVIESIPSDGENLHKVIEAMKHSVRILVKYRRYAKESFTEMVVEPYFVKLINKRWYCIVHKQDTKDKNGHIFVLSFDRILSLELTTERFHYPKNFDPIYFFRNNYGILWVEDTPIEKVIIRAFGTQVYYLRDLPLHHSQEEIATEDDYSDFELTLRPTPDFFTPLLSRGSLIKVLSPKWLAEEIKRQHIEAANLYE